MIRTLTTADQVRDVLARGGYILDDGRMQRLCEADGRDVRAWLQAIAYAKADCHPTIIVSGGDGAKLVRWELPS